MGSDDHGQNDSNAKLSALTADTVTVDGAVLTTSQGVAINDDTNTLKAGLRGPSLLEDFHIREKITHFDHERIPERVVHARGNGAHGYFQVYESQAAITKAGFLNDPSRRTPVFVRFSTVAGSRGSSDLARDARGFAVKFYTDEGIFDLVGNNIPVFFIQDAVKFPDFVHSVKPEPDSEMPQAASAHDTFYDFISLVPETFHMLMWVMSDRALPRSLRMMEGFGIHTFRLINTAGESRFVKFHWKPLLGMHSVLWEEAQMLSGVDPDFHRRDLWETLADGGVAEWELGIQIVEEKDEHKFDFDLLDPTKLIPEEMVPVKRIGKLTINRNPDNFFAETEQAAFHPGHVVPGIDFTNDPLLQGRLFSYTDTQLLRLGGPNFAQIPINRPVSPVRNNQRDGHMQQTINIGSGAYHPNTVTGGCPFQLSGDMGGFVSHAEGVSGAKVRGRGPKFFDHFTQAALFFNSQSDVEKQHIIDALTFELGNVTRPAIVDRMLVLLNKVDGALARGIADGLGREIPDGIEGRINMAVGADAGPETESQPVRMPPGNSPALSMANTVKDTIRTRRVAFLVADGVDDAGIAEVKSALEQAGAIVKIIGSRGGAARSANGNSVAVDVSLHNAASVTFDALYIPGGDASVATLGRDQRALRFVNETYRHCKAIAVTGASAGLLRAAVSGLDDNAISADRGIVTSSKAGSVAAPFIQAAAQHRNWEREKVIRAEAQA